MRKSVIERVTKETKINGTFEIEGSGRSELHSGIGFFDHMLDGFTRHGLFNLSLFCDGDLEVDGHHTVEDCGIVLGSLINEAVGDKAGIKRYGYFILPMDECLVLCAVDLCGRPYFSFEADFKTEKIGDLDTELIREFFYAVSYSGKMNLHIKVITPGNAHHMAEAMFKAFGKALDMATSKDERIEGILSTKGSL